MKKLRLIVAVIIFALMIALAVLGYNHLTKNYDSDSNIQSGGAEKDLKAADFTVLDKNQSEVKLSDSFGKPVIVNFWATWCTPCKSEMPVFNSFYKEYKDEINFMMINLTDGYQDTVEKVNEFITENGYEFPVYYDTKGNAANAYNVISVPVTLFINEKGEITDERIGSLDEKTLQSYIDKLLGGTNK